MLLKYRLIPMLKKILLQKTLDAVFHKAQWYDSFFSDFRERSKICNKYAYPIMFADGTSFFSSHNNTKDLFEIASKEIKNEWCSVYE